METIEWLSRVISCTPERVEMSFWDNSRELTGLFFGPRQIGRNIIKYSIESDRIKAILVFSDELKDSELEILISGITDCECLFLWLPNFSQFPDSIGNLTSLTSLNVGFTEITKLPEWIGSLSALASLDVSRTRITKLPEWIGSLSALASLYVDNTQSTKLPESIVNLSTLTSLSLGGTQITELPESIGSLSALASLYVDNTQLTKLPESIVNLSTLASLSLGGTQITELPESIGSLTALTSLDVGRTQITKLPESIGNLSALVSLKVSNTQITKLPESIGNLSALASLSLGGTQITELREGIGSLTALTSLDVWGTQITDLPEWIGSLTLLTMLDVSSTQITKLPESIGNLSALASLNVGNTQITELPEWIGSLTALTSLDVSGTQITNLPESIGNLSALTSLNVSFTQITNLPESIGNLTALTSLRIGGTQITELPEWIGNLTALTSLYMGGTQITELPKEVYKLPIMDLDLSNLKLETIPKEILNLDLPFSFSFRAAGILLSGTDISRIGISVFKQPREEIKLFYEELEREKVILNETRVIFVGDGGAGKSTIINRLMTDQYVEGLSETKGVMIKKWRIDNDPDNPLVSFWDFGGQAIMHSMHEFFLSQRCLYVLVLDGRRDESPEYWLDIISQYGRKSSVMVVMNKTDENESADIDRIRIKREYDAVFSDLSFHLISCKTEKGFDSFRSDLIENIRNAESCKEEFPGRWYRIKEKLTEMTDENKVAANYLREEDFRRYCNEEGITDKTPQDTLLRWLNDLGVCFSYKSKALSGAVEEIKVLRPEWITNGVYKIINSSEAKDCNGFINHETIKSVLENNDDVNPSYRNTERDFILNMMRDFMLSYPVGNNEFIPMLTTEAEPMIPPLENAVHFQIEYSVPLPASVLYSLVTLMKDDVDRTKTWRKGTYLQNRRRNSRAIVRFGKTKREIDVFVEGANKTDYLSQIRRNLDDAQGEINTEFTEKIEYTVKGKSTMLKLDRLLKLIIKGDQKDYADEIDEYVDITEVLACIAPDEVIKNLTENLKRSESEIDHLRGEKLSSEEMRRLLLRLDERTSTMEDTIIHLKNAVDSINFYSEVQLKMMQNLFKELDMRKKELELSNEIMSKIDELLIEVKKGNSGKLKKALAQFIHLSSSAVTLTPYIAPYIVKLLELFQSVAH